MKWSVSRVNSFDFHSCSYLNSGRYQVPGLGAGGTEISEHCLASQELRLMPRSSPSLSGALVSSPPLPALPHCQIPTSASSIVWMFLTGPQLTFMLKKYVHLVRRRNLALIGPLPFPPLLLPSHITPPPCLCLSSLNDAGISI